MNEPKYFLTTKWLTREELLRLYPSRDDEEIIEEAMLDSMVYGESMIRINTDGTCEKIYPLVVETEDETE